AYILWSLEQAGDKGGHIGRAVGYITKHLDDAKGDLYTLALSANALVSWNKSDPATLKLRPCTRAECSNPRSSP
ncbi:MAG TPA: hypothetical protein VM425_06255, partial [Myxococcota bacterium]|nr:hypothetical protein [Myxococcota bacterium]